MKRLAAILFAALSALTAVANDADVAWQRVTELDGGPREKPQSQAQARDVAMTHMTNQERSLRAFLSQFGSDSRAFEARLRLSRLLQIRADFEKSEKLRVEARGWLDSAEKIAKPEQQVEIDFARVTYLMRAQRTAAVIDSQGLLSAVRGFQRKHPDDRRLPALLVEVSSLFESQPRTKRTLLSDAQALTRDAELKARIEDDLKRLDLLGEPLALNFQSLQGQSVDVVAMRGRVVVIVFFASWSPPSTAAMERVKQAVARFPGDRVGVVAVSLDQTSALAQQALREQGVNWPTACDGKGWMSPLVRGYGINALPTVWLLDAQGRLRSLDALDTLTSQLRQLVPAAGG
jgi:peroxiredoxin